MESVIYEGGPLAQYLEASGQAENASLIQRNTSSVASTNSDHDVYAPRGLPKASAALGEADRESLRTQIVFRESILTRLRQKCMDTLAWRIGQSEKIKALEQLRFAVIGSHLLANDRGAGNGYSRRPSIAQPPSPDVDIIDDHPIEYTRLGLLCTAGGAFFCALSIWWATRPNGGHLVRTRVWLVGTILFALAFFAYGLCLRQYRRYARNHAIKTTSAMVSNAQSFDSAAHAASGFIQEVELVSRGYRLSSPLPPVSRLDDEKYQSRRCTRLRHALRSALDSLTKSHVEAYQALQPFANEQNFERYCDMYELSRLDVDEVQDSIKESTSDIDDSEALRVLKVDLHKLFTARKLFLCAILALDVDMKSNKLDWAMLTGIMETLSNNTAASVLSLDDILREEERSTTPPSPRSPTTPGREKIQNRIRKFTTLSQGLRGLQARMHILREESDKALGSSDEVAFVGSCLLEQYDAIGADLRVLLADWEDGRAALTANINKHERRVSIVSTGMALSGSTSPTSIGGLTAVGGSPPEAFKILNGESMPSLDAISSEEEVFEAMASPRPRGMLTREERIAKMREDRARQVTARERADAGRFMVKELETVIKARPRRTTTSRVTTL